MSPMRIAQVLKRRRREQELSHDLLALALEHAAPVALPLLLQVYHPKGCRQPFEALSIGIEKERAGFALREGRRKAMRQPRGSRLIVQCRPDGGGKSRVVRAESVHIFNRDRNADSVQGHWTSSLVLNRARGQPDLSRRRQMRVKAP